MENSVIIKEKIELEEKIKELTVKLKKLEDKEYNENRDRQEKIKNIIIEKSTYEIKKNNEYCLWDNREVFYITILQSVDVNDLTELTKDEIIYGLKSLELPRKSILYLISKKYKKIIGSTGSGCCMLEEDIDKGLKRWGHTEIEETNPRLKKVIENYLLKINNN